MPTYIGPNGLNLFLETATGLAGIAPVDELHDAIYFYLNQLKQFSTESMQECLARESRLWDELLSILSSTDGTQLDGADAPEPLRDKLRGRLKRSVILPEDDGYLEPVAA